MDVTSLLISQSSNSTLLADFVTNIVFNSQSANLDYNWLFSAIAQSAAAIVGVVGAFIVAKLISLESDYHFIHLEVDRYLADSKKDSNQIANFYIDSYPIYQLKTLQNIIDKYVYLIHKLKILKGIINEQKLYKLIYFEPKNINVIIEGKFKNSKLISQDYPEKEIDQIDIEIKRQQELNSSLLNRIRSHTTAIKTLIGAIIFILLFFFGSVLTPLLFMPLNGIKSSNFFYPPHKWIVLSVFAFLFLFAMIFILFYLKKINFEKKHKKKNNDLIKFTDLNSFHKAYGYKKEILEMLDKMIAEQEEKQNGNT